MKYNIKIILLALILWVGSYFWLLTEGNQAPISVYTWVSQTLAMFEMPHDAPTVEMITTTSISTILFINIAIWSVVLYKHTIVKFMTPPPKKPAPKPEPGGNIIINQHFGPEAKPAAPPK